MFLRFFWRSERRGKARVIKDEMRRLLDEGHYIYVRHGGEDLPPGVLESYYQQMADKIVEFAITDPEYARGSIATFLPMIEGSPNYRRSAYIRSLRSGQPCS